MPRSRQSAIESAIIARFSSAETLITFSRCSPQLLPTRQTIGAKLSSSTASASSSAAATPRRLVIPKAAIVAFSSGVSASWAKSSASFGFELGKPASMNCTPSSSSACTTFSFSPTESDIPGPPIPSRRVVS